MQMHLAVNALRMGLIPYSEHSAERCVEKIQTPFIRTKTQSENFRGNPLCQTTKRHLTNKTTVKR